MNFIPVIDLQARETTALAREIGAALETSGFFVLLGHGVPQPLIERMFARTTEFFHLPEAEKLRVAQGPGVSGYRPENPPDLCASFAAHVTGDLGAAERAALGEQWAPWKLANSWPRDPEGFRETWQEYLAALTGLSAELVRLFALALGLPGQHFADRFDRHVSALVANHYPPQLDAPPPGQVRRSAHTDFGALTVLCQQEDRTGLQVRQGGGWCDVPASPGSFVVNIGDLMSRWTGGRWRSTLHRVVNPPRADTSSRLSIPFFYQPNHDAPGETAGQWMSRRVAELLGAPDRVTTPVQ